MADIIKRCILFLSCILLVSACASRKIPEPKQKSSQKPYTVMGQRYEPLQTHKGFVQTGVASWYGKDFHGKKTSNGEKYDMNAMTAAHKTLPLGVFVKVRNTLNGHETVVRVNDRGPFVKGRIIDLSYAAAKLLGVDIAGTAPVRIEALGYRGSGVDSYKVLENYDNGSYSVQVGSFKDYGNAERLSAEMKKRYGFSEVHKTNVSGEDFYRVYAGKYTSLNVAEHAEQEFCEQVNPKSFTVSLE
jgi:rare lipoprotein A